MTDTLWLYSALPAGPCIVFAFLLAKLWKRKAEKFYVILFSSLLMMNLLQMVGYFALSLSRPAGEIFADAYMIAAYFFFGSLLLTCASLHEFKTFDPKRLYWLLSLPAMVSLLHIAGFVTDGYRYENNAFLHNDGPLAIVTDIFMLGCCVGSVLALIVNTKFARDKTNLSKNIVALASFIPLAGALFVVVALSRTEYAIPVVVVGPIFYLYAGMMFYYISQEEVVDLTIGVRFVSDRLRLCHALLSGRQDKKAVKQLMKQIEWQYIKEALYEHDGNIMETAEALGMNHNTIRTKIKEQEALESVQTPSNTASPITIPVNRRR